MWHIAFNITNLIDYIVRPGVTLAFRLTHAHRNVSFNSLDNYGKPLCLFVVIPNDACTYNLLIEEL